MGFLASDKGGDFQIAPPGVYTARCYKMIDIGTQTTTGPFGTKDQYMIMLQWELFDDEDHSTDENWKPAVISQRYNLSLHEKSRLRKDLEAWRGVPFTKEELESFDVSKVLGTYCTMQIVHDDTGKYANISSIMAMSKKAEKPKPFNADVKYSIDEDNKAIFEALSDNMKQKIMASPEWQGKHKLAPSGTAQKEDVSIQDQQKAMGTLDQEDINIDDIPF